MPDDATAATAADHAEVRVPLTPPQGVEDVTALVSAAGRPGAAAVILAHGAGTDLRHRAMARHAADLAAAGHPVARFNFAYTERGGKRPDPPARLRAAWADAIRTLHPILGGDRPLVVGGRSMGGRIASIVTAEAADDLGIAGVLCFAYPLHPPGKPDRLRVDHWPDLSAPVLLLSGTRDAMAPVDALQANVAAHMPAGLATVHLLQGGDHSFGARKADGRTSDEVFAEADAAAVGWLRRFG